MRKKQKAKKDVDTLLIDDDTMELIEQLRPKGATLGTLTEEQKAVIRYCSSLTPPMTRAHISAVFEKKGWGKICKGTMAYWVEKLRAQG